LGRSRKGPGEREGIGGAEGSGHVHYELVNAVFQGKVGKKGIHASEGKEKKA